MNTPTLWMAFILATGLLAGGAITIDRWLERRQWRRIESRRQSDWDAHVEAAIRQSRDRHPSRDALNYAAMYLAGVTCGNTECRVCRRTRNG